VRVVLAAFAATALLIVLQTLIFQLLPWDSRASAAVSLGLRVGFLLADVAVVVSLVMLARAEPTARGLPAIGAALAAFAVVSDLAGLAAKLFGSEARALREVTLATTGAEPIASMGAALLATLALGALADPHGWKAMARVRGVTIAVVPSVVLSLVFRFSRLALTTPRSVPAAWASWLVEVFRPVLIALLALSLLRALARAAKVDVRPEGPYRAAAEGASPAVAREPLDAAFIASLRTVARGLSSYRVIFMARIGAGVVTTLVMLAVSTMVRSGGPAVALTLLPLASMLTGVLLALSLRKLLALPRGVGARGVAIGALLAIVVAVLLDTGALVLSVSAIASASWYRARRDVIDCVFATWPVVALAGGVSILFVASATRRLGDRLQDARVVGRARWVQGIAIAAGATQIGTVLATLSASSATYGSTLSPAAFLVLGLLVITALGTTVAAVVLHMLLVGAARLSILAEVEGQPRAG
jgi:hypothetical protein